MISQEAHLSRERLKRLVILGFVALYTVVLCRTAWVGDDAYLTFRTVDNLLHGFGLRWNVAERVQAYTHPLWMLTLASAELVTREPYFTSIAVSLVCAVAAVSFTAWRIARTFWQAVACVVVLMSAKSFVDFSTSGLENSLSHALIVGYLLTLMRPTSVGRPWLPVAVASLAFVNRQDLVWLLGPSLLAHLYQVRRATLGRTMLIGFWPFLLWELFSAIYYGALVPNTALAKLATGIPEYDLAVQGLRYLQDSWRRDPLTLAITAASIPAGLFRVRSACSGTPQQSIPLVHGWTLAVGQCLYLAYVVWIGGDFMSGRFLTAPLILGVARLAAAPVNVRPVVGAVVAISLVGVCGLFSGMPSVLSGSRFGEGRIYVDFHGIADEREYYYPRTGLLRASRPLSAPDLIDAELAHRMLAAGQRVAMREMVGMFGYAAGPELYVVDPFGLGDPLLARLPATSPWRIGHFHRNLPAGYIQTLRSGRNQIVDPGVASYYDVLTLITRGQVFSANRLHAAAALNLGVYDGLLREYRSGVWR